ncbi:Ras-specific guanine nucleotide-releasing factor RalGPS1 [Elysia marginata]|uniref:RBPJ-interacting and tubulin-associated protein 1 n=1 Tax=Elysia marginata TaxID=1093978 RepID=A0AAV4I331_9GAST|nr:Ras-specific guanine nucleotide-releasing factor RalGPS1 [Elysia marginata]
MSGDFVVMGTRAPSALSSSRPSSASTRHHGYHAKARSSFVDESLFGSYHHTRLDEELKSFKAPWEYPKPPTPRNTFAVPLRTKPVVKPKPKGRPLLWCPSPDSATKLYPKRATGKPDSDSVKSSSNENYMWNTRDHFRRLKHTPTFVDESLFGPRLQEPTFEAPWNERKKGEKRPVKPYLFDPSSNGMSSENAAVKRRPATALGLSRGDTKRHHEYGNQRQVWKP